MNEYIKLNTYEDATVLVEKSFFDTLLEDTFQTTYFDFMNDYTWDDAEEILSQAWATNEAAFKVLGYYREPVPAEEEANIAEAARVSVVIDEGGDRLTFYTPIGQHSEGDRGYFETTTRISKKEYLKASKGYYTPEDYL
jgi:hypothetical protein